MAWLILVGLFLITAFTTYGFFASVAEARREKERDDLAEAVPVPADRGALSARLTEHLRALAGSGTGTAEWLRKTRVPYGHCTSREECDRRTRCIQCQHFETTEEDLPALRRLLEQEVALAEAAQERGLAREADIHRSIASSVRKHLEPFEKQTEVA